ncbi:unnamed protein product [Medioppia subpectinata]|uniref:Mandelate racemase/muconate lactonizing enzyme C-terminal domain-containing protein n=1 Tax=Medioppia subpectinata TaxID=1979941 RepID=A0A7R9KCZ9_9ACAR|nr:unnamed protein product [Medioppia subpectinata]CAG2100962.1 unnamed protein product [Medioppia subpectinata]
MMFTEVDVFIGNNTLIDPQIYQYWLEGNTAQEASRLVRNKEKTVLGLVHEDLVISDILDQYRTFLLIEKLLPAPTQLSEQWTHQLTPTTQRILVEKYYDFEDSVIREILGKKLSGRNRKDLDDVSDKTAVGIKSCRRQFDNVKRVYKTVEDMSGNLSLNIQTNFLLPKNLAQKYAAVVYIANNRFETNKRKLQYLQFSDFLHCSTEMMANWSCSDPECKYEETAMDIDREFLQNLREFRVLLEREAIDEHKTLVMRILKAKVSDRKLADIDSMFKSLSRNVINIAYGLNHSKEMRDLFLDIVEKIIEPSKNAKLSVSDMTLLMTQYKEGPQFMEPFKTYHTDPDYSCAYVILKTETNGFEGHGLTFTIGKGTEVVVKAVECLKPLVEGKKLANIYNNFGPFWTSLACDSQRRWIGPEKGAIHMATGAVINALWDLWCKIEGKPLWKLLVDLEPEKLVSCIDFRYITDVLTKEEAIEILKKNRPFNKERGSVGLDMMSRRGENCVDNIWQKVTLDLRLAIIREEIGYENLLMVDANQKWDVNEAIEWMKQLTDFKILWIEEPTSPDDVLGHATISKALKPYGIGVATGEQCQNRVLFKQFLQANGLQFLQIDSCRLGGVNEILSIILMAHKFGVPVCPHAGGVGLCEYVQHLSMWDFVSVSGSMDNRMTEYIHHLSEHFTYPASAKSGRYLAPKHAGYGCELKEESIKYYEFPNGTYWSTKQ